MSKIRVAFVYKRSYKFLSEDHYDKTTYYFFMEALKRNTRLDVTYFPCNYSFDVKEHERNFDVILIPNNNIDGTPDLIGIKESKLPVICRTGDPHWAKKLNQFQFHNAWKINYYFNFMDSSYFYKFYPREFLYKTIIMGLEPKLYDNISNDFKSRIEDRILNSGVVGKKSIVSRVANFILNHNRSSWYFYKLRTICNKLPYVDHFGMKQGKYSGTYQELLSKYRACIAATTFYPTIKYLEVPASGCLTFMEITEKNHGDYLGFKDGENAIFINTKNYRKKFQEYLANPDNHKWEQIANAGKEYCMKNLTNDNAVEVLADLMESIINNKTMNDHKHIPRIIERNTMTYQKGTMICSVCGLKLKDPTDEVLQ